MQPFYVYILKCNDGSYYVGQTDNIDQRLDQHNQKVTDLYTYVSHRLPFELVFVEIVESRDAALEGERKLKGWSRKKKELLINSGWQAMEGFWKNKNF